VLRLSVRLLKVLTHTPLQHGYGVRIDSKIGPESSLKNFTISAGGSFRGLHFGFLIVLGHPSFPPSFDLSIGMSPNATFSAHSVIFADTTNEADPKESEI
jgi:hypothetical protein